MLLQFNLITPERVRISVNVTKITRYKIFNCHDIALEYESYDAKNGDRIRFSISEFIKTKKWLYMLELLESADAANYTILLEMLKPMKWL